MDHFIPPRCKCPRWQSYMLSHRHHQIFLCFFPLCFNNLCIKSFSKCHPHLLFWVGRPDIPTAEYEPPSIQSLVSLFTEYRRDKKKPSEFTCKWKVKCSTLDSGPMWLQTLGKTVFHMLSYFTKKISLMGTHALLAWSPPIHSQHRMGKFTYLENKPPIPGAAESRIESIQSHKTFKTTCRTILN